MVDGIPDEKAWYQTGSLGSVRASLHDEVKIALRKHIAGGWDGTTVTSLRDHGHAGSQRSHGSYGARCGRSGEVQCVSR